MSSSCSKWQYQAAMGWNDFGTECADFTPFGGAGAVHTERAMFASLCLVGRGCAYSKSGANLQIAGAYYFGPLSRQ